MSKTYTAVSYKIYPNKAQEAALFLHLNLTRELYNACIEERSAAYKKQKKSISKYDQSGAIPEIKRYRPEFKLIYNSVLQDVCARVDKSFQNFFRGIKQGRKVGYPRYQGKMFWDSFSYALGQNSKTFKWYGPGKRVGSRIYLPHIGNVKTKWHRELPGRCAIVSVIRKADGWYVNYTCEIEKPAALPETGKMVGIDLGLTSFITTSEGEEVKITRAFRANQGKLGRLQRRVSKMKKGGKNRRKAQVQVARLHKRVADTRRNEHRRIANQLIGKYDMVACEALSIRGLSRGILAKHVLDVAWGQFVTILNYKADRYGRTVIAVNPKNTTQACSGCGVIVPKGLADRIHKCPDCGTELGRDHNAAINILKLALDKA